MFSCITLRLNSYRRYSLDDICSSIQFGININWVVFRSTQITKFMGPAWGPPGSCRPQMGPMLAPWTLLSGLRISLNLEAVNPWTTVSIWVCTQHCSWWCSGAKAPGSQYPICWLDILILDQFHTVIVHLKAMVLEIEITFEKNCLRFKSVCMSISHTCIYLFRALFCKYWFACPPNYFDQLITQSSKLSSHVVWFTQIQPHELQHSLSWYIMVSFLQYVHDKHHINGLMQDCSISSVSSGDTAVLHWAIDISCSLGHDVGWLLWVLSLHTWYIVVIFLQIFHLRWPIPHTWGTPWAKMSTTSPGVSSQ